METEHIIQRNEKKPEKKKRAKRRRRDVNGSNTSKHQQKQQNRRQRRTTPRAGCTKLKDGKVVEKNQTCPRCGDGVFLATHKDRVSCGKCGYTEYKK